ncbi:hypothetical protein AMECASPLE_039742 [Ameca splendens]|uniref:Uncharacterized protein n=1 Tax=Ameca splendens TaxID=208324 RepID=A0ABV0XLM6_9TELE
MECIYEDDPTVAAGQSVGGKSLDEEDMQVDDGIQDEPDTFLKTDPQQLLDQWMEAEDLAVSVPAQLSVFAYPELIGKLREG